MIIKKGGSKWIKTDRDNLKKEKENNQQRSYPNKKVPQKLAPAETRSCRVVCKCPNRNLSRNQNSAEARVLAQPCGVLTQFIIHFQISLVAPSHIFRVQRRKHPWNAPGSKTRSSVSTSAHSKGVANRCWRAEHHRGMEGTQNSIWPGTIILIAAVCEWRPSARDTKSTLCCWTGLHLLISLREQKNTSVLHGQASAKMLLACYKIESSWKE